MLTQRPHRSTLPQGWVGVAVALLHLALGWGLIHQAPHGGADQGHFQRLAQAQPSGPQVIMLSLKPLPGLREKAALPGATLALAGLPSGGLAARHPAAVRVADGAAAAPMAIAPVGAGDGAEAPSGVAVRAPASANAGRASGPEPATAVGDTVARSTVGPRPVAGNPLPRYPEAAREDGLEGAVRLRVEVAADGHVQAVQWAMRSGVMLLDLAAREAVRLWRFQPALNEGVPVAGSLVVTLQFRLHGETVLIAMADPMLR